MAKAKERGNKASIQGLQAPTQEFFVAEVDCSRAIIARSTSLRRHCEERSDGPIHLSPCGGVDCFASLAMTWKEFAAAYQVRHLPRRLRPY
ncbi:hypothetical protein ACH79_28265 [Bradyrhizobium sp. CCBAU 051011]|nr:hypothetical protein ACH79_28265 [Bradyrhizobium sp. CCBAU 051011]